MENSFQALGRFCIDQIRQTFTLRPQDSQIAFALPIKPRFVLQGISDPFERHKHPFIPYSIAQIHNHPIS
jgi:hypothetical protein